MGFEIYTPGFGRHLSDVRDPLVSIQRAGNLAFSGGAEELLGLTPNGRIVMLFDRQVGQIGIRLPRPGDPANARLTLSGREGRQALRVGAKGFFSTYNIDLAKLPGYLLIGRDDVSGLSIVQLPQGSWLKSQDITRIRERLQSRRTAS